THTPGCIEARAGAPANSSLPLCLATLLMSAFVPFERLCECVHTYVCVSTYVSVCRYCMSLSVRVYKNVLCLCCVVGVVCWCVCVFVCVYICMCVCVYIL